MTDGNGGDLHSSMMHEPRRIPRKILSMLFKRSMIEPESCNHTAVNITGNNHTAVNVTGNNPTDVNVTRNKYTAVNITGSNRIAINITQQMTSACTKPPTRNGSWEFSWPPSSMSFVANYLPVEPRLRASK